MLSSEPGTDPLLGHAWGEWEVVTEATPWLEGEKTRACTREGCEETESRTIAPLTPFLQSMTVDGVVVIVRAEEGVFPADAVLSVLPVAESELARVEEAMGALREEGQEAAVSAVARSLRRSRDD